MMLVFALGLACLGVTYVMTKDSECVSRFGFCVAQGTCGAVGASLACYLRVMNLL